jgi:hypothetical protein
MGDTDMIRMTFTGAKDERGPASDKDGKFF